jgi:hypothetical protein
MINLTENRIEAGYHHDDTGRWIDCSYDRYDICVRSQAALAKLTKGFEDLLTKLEEIRLTRESDFLTAAGLAQAEYERRLTEYEQKMKERLRMSWWRAMLASRPVCPEYSEPDRDALIEIERAKAKLTELLNLTNSLDPQFGEYTASNKRDYPFEYNIMVLRDLPPAEVMVAIQQLNRR